MADLGSRAATVLEPETARKPAEPCDWSRGRPELPHTPRRWRLTFRCACGHIEHVHLCPGCKEMAVLSAADGDLCCLGCREDVAPPHPCPSKIVLVTELRAP